MASLTILGSGSGMPNSDRACSGYLVEHKGRLTLLDCGSGVCRSFLNLEYDLLALDRIVVSHTHPDHVCELPLLIQYLHLSKRATPIDIYLPAEFESVFGQMLRAMYVIPERFAFETRIHGYREGLVDSRPPVIEAIANWHLARYTDDVLRFGLKNRTQSFSFRVAFDDFSLFYSGDVASFDEIRQYVEQCDLALLESSHVDMALVAESARSHPRVRVILTHFTDGKTADQVAEITRNIPTIVLAKDGMRIDLVPLR